MSLSEYTLGTVNIINTWGSLKSSLFGLGFFFSDCHRNRITHLWSSDLSLSLPVMDTWALVGLCISTLSLLITQQHSVARIPRLAVLPCPGMPLLAPILSHCHQRFCELCVACFCSLSPPVLLNMNRDFWKGRYHFLRNSRPYSKVVYIPYIPYPCGKA